MHTAPREIMKKIQRNSSPPGKSTTKSVSLTFTLLRISLLTNFPQPYLLYQRRDFLSGTFKTHSILLCSKALEADLSSLIHVMLRLLFNWVENKVTMEIVREHTPIKINWFNKIQIEVAADMSNDMKMSPAIVRLGANRAQNVLIENARTFVVPNVMILLSAPRTTKTC